MFFIGVVLYPGNEGDAKGGFGGEMLTQSLQMLSLLVAVFERVVNFVDLSSALVSPVPQFLSVTD